MSVNSISWGSDIRNAAPAIAGASSVASMRSTGSSVLDTAMQASLALLESELSRAPRPPSAPGSGIPAAAIGPGATVVANRFNPYENQFPNLSGPATQSLPQALTPGGPSSSTEIALVGQPPGTELVPHGQQLSPLVSGISAAGTETAVASGVTDWIRRALEAEREAFVRTNQVMHMNDYMNRFRESFNMTPSWRTN
jgi:hypothetical protein